MKKSVLIVWTVAFVTYCLMAAKQYTWLFASGDSGDWLAASNMWIVPQPYGSPLYIMLGHFLNLFPGDLVIKMTILLSCLPSAITVTAVFLIVHHLSGKKILAWLGAFIILSAGILLTQSTVLEEYAIAVMFATLAYYFFITDKRKLTIVMLGLGSAVHVVVIMLSVLWLFLARAEFKKWLKLMPLYIVIGILPYCLILYLMAIDTPPLLAGYGLSLESLNAYTGSTSVFGTLSIFDLPERLAQFFSIIIMSFGLAIIPAVIFFKTRPWQLWQKLLFVNIFFPIWYYMTCLDPTSWTFMSYACPSIAIVATLGISKLNFSKVKTMTAIGLSTMVIFAFNLTFLNANALAAEVPNATDYLAEVEKLPDGSAIVTNRGGFESMVMYYAISEGKDLIPLFITDNPDGSLYQQYTEWLSDKYEIEGTTTQEIAQDAMNDGYEVYCIVKILERWEPVFDTEKTEFERFNKVKGVNFDYIVPEEDY